MPRIPRSIENSFSYCFCGKLTGIDTLINIDGYYKEMRLYKRSPTIGGFLKDTSIYYIDTSYTRFMFYDNGIFVTGIMDSYYDEKKKELVKKDASLFLKDFAENIEAAGARLFYSFLWGGYVIIGDTIKTQSISQGRTLNSGWHLREDWYKIIDSNTIQRINAFNLPTSQISQPVNKKSSPITFVHIPSKPEPYHSWILKERWFWCKEGDYLEYMTSLKTSDVEK